MEELKVTVENGVKTLEIRTGKALELKEPTKVEINACIETPLEWLKQRREKINEKNAHVIINKDKGSITLIEDECNPYGAVITGKLELSPIFMKFGINEGNYRTPLEMSEFIKMNRVYFENRQTAMKLVTELRNFKAKIDKEVEQEVNLNRGDRRLVLAQAVESNVPETFNVNIPIFKGSEKVVFEVETYFNPDDLTCTLVSPAANEITEDFKESIIDGIASQIQMECPNTVIIYK